MMIFYEMIFKRRNIRVHLYFAFTKLMTITMYYVYEALKPSVWDIFVMTLVNLLRNSCL